MSEEIKVRTLTTSVAILHGVRPMSVGIRLGNILANYGGGYHEETSEGVTVFCVGGVQEGNLELIECDHHYTLSITTHSDRLERVHKVLHKVANDLEEPRFNPEKSIDLT